LLIPKLEDVLRARRVIGEVVIETPLVFAERLSETFGARVYLKLENFQRTGAFKFRGAYNCVSQLDGEARRAGLVTASSGNHALGLSLSAHIYQVNAVVVMPTTAPPAKQARAKFYGAEVILYGSIYDEACDHAMRFAAQRGMTYVPSFDHAHIIAGQGTMGLEILEQNPSVDLILAPVGGGGLLAGLITAGTGAEVVGVQAEGAAAMVRSLEKGERRALPAISTIADGIATLKPGELTFAVAARHQARVVTVSDDQIIAAMGRLLSSGVVAEPAAAASVAALSGLGSIAGRTVACVITGGNVSGTLLARAAGELSEQN